MHGKPEKKAGTCLVILTSSKHLWLVKHEKTGTCLVNSERCRHMLGKPKTQQTTVLGDSKKKANAWYTREKSRHMLGKPGKQQTCVLGGT